jgi:hypothetical protein
VHAADRLEKAFFKMASDKLAVISAQLSDIPARVKKIEETPLPIGTSSVTRVAEKTHDFGGAPFVPSLLHPLRFCRFRPCDP